MMIGAAGALTAFGGLLYEPGNYAAQDNLVVNFDGIRNAGPLKAHDSAARDAEGKRRRVSGVKVEEWNGSAWVSAGFFKGDSYTYNATSGTKVRLTWKWRGGDTVIILR